MGASGPDGLRGPAGVRGKPVSLTSMMKCSTKLHTCICFEKLNLKRELPFLCTSVEEYFQVQGFMQLLNEQSKLNH